MVRVPISQPVVLPGRSGSKFRVSSSGEIGERQWNLAFSIPMMNGEVGKRAGESISGQENHHRTPYIFSSAEYTLRLRMYIIRPRERTSRSPFLSISTLKPTCSVRGSLPAGVTSKSWIQTRDCCACAPILILILILVLLSIFPSSLLLFTLRPIPTLQRQHPIQPNPARSNSTRCQP